MAVLDVGLDIESALTTLAFCWRLDRRDGIAMGFTTHDSDLIVDGLVHRAAPGMLPSAISLSDGFDVDTLDVSGALTSDAIREDDLAAGRWDGASVRLSLADWGSPDAPPMLLARGEIGAVSIEDGRFTAELLGATALLERPAVELTSPECRAELGDPRCGVDLAARTRLLRVIEAVEPGVLRVEAVEPEADAHGYGRLRWIEGANSGLSAAIQSSEEDLVRLREPPPFAVAGGELIELMQGCDKRFETCSARFANAANFRGEPHLPGNDLLTRYPGA